MVGPHIPLSRRQRLLRRFVPLVAGTAALVWLAASALDGGTATVPATSTRTTTARVVRTTPTTPAATTVPVTTTTSAAGALPQTGTYPSSSSPQFQAAMAELFGAVAHGNPVAAAGAFFPEAAYVQLKSIPGAAADYENRLVAEYDQDIAATNAALGPDAASATLASVEVPMQYAHWVPPGECENSVGYFEVANSRVVYALGGVTRSFGIASLISWRGEWYVVHLGAILRPGTGGVVLDPRTGPGSSAPSTTC
ncbi:MAG TPA: hypothetical protein VND44_07325 [Acidimicrobiales bacterium]|nr:hypothetical protein [Acidimicrobiales bacterium]